MVAIRPPSIVPGNYQKIRFVETLRRNVSTQANIPFERRQQKKSAPMGAFRRQEEIIA
jgi:hypothetical protein